MTVQPDAGSGVGLRLDLLPSDLRTELERPRDVLLDREGISVHHASCLSGLDDLDLDLEPGVLSAAEMASWGRRACCSGFHGSPDAALSDELGPLVDFLDAAAALVSASRDGLIGNWHSSSALQASLTFEASFPLASPWCAHVRTQLERARADLDAWAARDGFEALRCAAAADAIDQVWHSWLLNSDDSGDFPAPPRRPRTVAELLALDPERDDLHELVDPRAAQRLRSEVLEELERQSPGPDVLVVLKSPHERLLVNDFLDHVLERHRVARSPLSAYVVPSELRTIGPPVRVLARLELPASPVLGDPLVETVLTLLSDGVAPGSVLAVASELS
jgi:hypothetical protein